MVVSKRRTIRRKGRLSVRKRAFRSRKRSAPRPKVLARSANQVGFPMPKLVITSHKYVAQVQINPGAGVTGSYLFRANDLYDPDYTGTGHQPLGFDQMMVFYDHFKVLGSSIRVAYTPTGTASIVGLGIVDQTGFSGTSEALMEQRGFKWRSMAAAGSEGAVVMSKKVDLPKYFGQSFRGYMAENKYEGSGSASPTEDVFWQLFVGPANGSDDIPSTYVNVEIHYRVAYYEPKYLPQS